MPSILILLRTYAAVLNSYAQYFFAILRTISHKVRLRRSAMSFCSGLYGTVNSWDTFSSPHNTDIFIFVFAIFVTAQAFDYDYSLRLDFFVKFFKLRHDFRFVSYRIYLCILCKLNVAKSFIPLFDDTSKGPITSEHTDPLSSWSNKFFWKRFLVCFTALHASISLRMYAWVLYNYRFAAFKASVFGFIVFDFIRNASHCMAPISLRNVFSFTDGLIAWTNWS